MSPIICVYATATVLASYGFKMLFDVTTDDEFELSFYQKPSQNKAQSVFRLQGVNYELVSEDFSTCLSAQFNDFQLNNMTVGFPYSNITSQEIPEPSISFLEHVKYKQNQTEDNCGPFKYELQENQPFLNLETYHNMSQPQMQLKSHQYYAGEHKCSIKVTLEEYPGVEPLLINFYSIINYEQESIPELQPLQPLIHEINNFELPHISKIKEVYYSLLAVVVLIFTFIVRYQKQQKVVFDLNQETKSELQLTKVKLYNQIEILQSYKQTQKDKEFTLQAKIQDLSNSHLITLQEHKTNHEKQIGKIKAQTETQIKSNLNEHANQIAEIKLIHQTEKIAQQSELKVWESKYCQELENNQSLIEEHKEAITFHLRFQSDIVAEMQQQKLDWAKTKMNLDTQIQSLIETHSGEIEELKTKSDSEIERLKEFTAFEKQTHFKVIEEMAKSNQEDKLKQVQQSQADREILLTEICELKSNHKQQEQTWEQYNSEQEDKFKNELEQLSQQHELEVTLMKQDILNSYEAQKKAAEQNHAQQLKTMQDKFTSERKDYAKKVMDLAEKHAVELATQTRDWQDRLAEMLNVVQAPIEISTFEESKLEITHQIDNPEDLTDDNFILEKSLYEPIEGKVKTASAQFKAVQQNFTQLNLTNQDLLKKLMHAKAECKEQKKQLISLELDYSLLKIEYQKLVDQVRENRQIDEIVNFSWMKQGTTGDVFTQNKKERASPDKLWEHLELSMIKEDDDCQSTQIQSTETTPRDMEVEPKLNLSEDQKRIQFHYSPRVKREYRQENDFGVSLKDRESIQLQSSPSHLDIQPNSTILEDQDSDASILNNLNNYLE